MKKQQNNSITNFRGYAVYECSYYTEPFDGNLVWCTHQANDSNHEGNCRVEFCPIIKEIDKFLEINKFIKDLKDKK